MGGDVLFSFEQIVQETRLAAARGIVELGVFHLFLSQENMYLFDGTRLTRIISKRINESLKRNMNLTYVKRAIAFHDKIHQRVYWSIPTGDGTSKQYTLDYDVYDISNIQWCLLELTDSPTAMGIYPRDAFLSWDSAAVAGITWEDMDGTWDSMAGVEGFPVRVFGSGVEVFELNEFTIGDNETAVVASWESKDFTVPQVYQSLFARWMELELELKGGEIDVSYSTDEGFSWTAIKTLTLDGDWERYDCYFDVASKKIRFKLEGERFKMRWLRVWLTPQVGT